MDRDFIKDEDWEDCQHSPELQKVYTNIGRRHFEKIVENYNLNRNRNISKPSSLNDLRIVVTGKTGVGKSAVANTILGEKLFEEGSTTKSVTSLSRGITREINGRKISVIDTPGLQDTDRPPKEVLREIARVMKIFHNGVHVFVYVLNMASPRFTYEDRSSLAAIEMKFGSNMKQYRLLVYTHPENSLTDEMTLENFFHSQRVENEHIASLFDETDGYMIAVNNNAQLPAEKKWNQNAVLALIDKLVARNDKSVYTNEMFEKASQERKSLCETLVQRGCNLTVIENVEKFIAANPDITARTSEFIRGVKQHLEEEIKRSRDSILKIKQKRAEREIEVIQFQIKEQAARDPGKDLEQKVADAETSVKITTEALCSTKLDDQIEEIGKWHEKVLKGLQDYIKRIWRQSTIMFSV
ncbi:GTPase IMAP family member 4 [Holothuria leucospilota]|uniref:GTPase IMAP family member 4 n=1 Tax=Holothuria leucospilota TaxID=206669 RepID=A0A9Q0YEW1_HOLLE|nr:GTPase IMAP family member 4 [Holothuria leucospilota]